MREFGKWIPAQRRHFSAETVLRGQRNFARVSTADLGAAEFQGASDMRRYWLTALHPRRVIALKSARKIER